MATVSTYLNFDRTTEEAFTFYKSVFGTEFEGDGIMRLGDVPASPDQKTAEEDKDLVMHVSLPILGGHVLMGTDAPESMTGRKFVQGNNVYITLRPDTRAESDRLFAALSEGGSVEMEMQEMFWGDYYGSWTDRFGVQWMINCTEK